MSVTRRKFDHEFREGRCGLSGIPVIRSPRWPQTPIGAFASVRQGAASRGC